MRASLPPSKAIYWLTLAALFLGIQGYSVRGKRCTGNNMYTGRPGHDYFRAQTSVTEQDKGNKHSLISIKLEYFETDDRTWRPLMWKHLEVMMARKLHVVVLGEDLDVYAHVHPDDSAAVAEDQTAFDVQVHLPASGEYTVVMDYIVNTNKVGMCVDEDSVHFHPANRNPWESQSLVAVLSKTRFTLSSTTPPTLPAMKSSEQLPWDPSPVVTIHSVQSMQKDLYPYAVRGSELKSRCCPKPEQPNATPDPDCYTVEIGRMDDSYSGTQPFTVRPAECVKYMFQVSQNGEPTSTLTPYLGAEGHLLVLSADREIALHEHVMSGTNGAKIVWKPDNSVVDRCLMPHGEAMTVAEQFGPGLMARFALPKAGYYKVFLTVARAGELVIASFTVLVDGAWAGSSDPRIDTATPAQRAAAAEAHVPPRPACTACTASPLHSESTASPIQPACTASPLHSDSGSGSDSDSDYDEDGLGIQVRESESTRVSLDLGDSPRSKDSNKQVALGAVVMGGAILLPLGTWGVYAMVKRKQTSNASKYVDMEAKEPSSGAEMEMGAVVSDIDKRTR